MREGRRERGREVFVIPDRAGTKGSDGCDVRHGMQDTENREGLHLRGSDCRHFAGRVGREGGREEGGSVRREWHEVYTKDGRTG